MNETPTATEQVLRAMAARRLQLPADLVPLDVPLFEGLGLDSLDVVDLIAEVETHYPRVNLYDKAAEAVRTLRDLATYIDAEIVRRSSG